jgi:hypothetical protein
LTEERLGQFLQATGAAEFAPTVSSFTLVAFLTKSETTLAAVAVVPEREQDGEAVAALIWNHSQVKSEALLPIEGSWSAFGAGRFIGLVLGSFLGVFALGGAAAWLLVKAGLASGVAVVVACVFLIGLSVVGVVRGDASVDSLLQLLSCLIASGVAYRPLSAWLATSAGTPPPDQPSPRGAR